MICGVRIGARVTIATRGATGAALISCAAGSCEAGAIVVTLQQQLARIVEIGGASCLFGFGGQQHDCRIWPSMLHKKLVRANADDGSSTASAKSVRITRRTVSQP